MALNSLIELSADYVGKETGNVQILPSLSIYFRDEISTFEAVVYEPLICLILQGSKVTSAGDQQANLHVGDALLVSHDLPVMSAVTTATAQEPYIALILSLDLNDIRRLNAQIGDGLKPDPNVTPLSCAPADPAWLEPLIRYVELAKNPSDANILGPSVLREIQYRLLLSPIGQMLRSLLVADSNASRVGQAIAKLRSDFRSPMIVADIANSVGMSVSSFHKHFKSVTGITPVQYQKDLRLIEARALLAGKGATVAEAAFAVGYESPTHFSRDYRRKFGLPPSRDSLA